MENGPSLPEITRRLQRLEDRMDLRLVTIDVYEAREATAAIQVENLTDRVKDLEGTISVATRMVMFSFLAIIVEAVVLALAVFGGG